MRLAMPDQACKSIDVPLADGRSVRYAGGRDGTVEVANPEHARRLIREGEAFPASGAPAARPGGYPCPCGFSSLFRRCSRCGSDNPKETS